MIVVGFDIGNDNCVIAAAQHRGIDVLLNDESNRETPSVVSFTEKQRFIGSAGAASAMMNPRFTISQLKRLIGRRFDEDRMQRELHFLPFKISPAADGGIMVHVRYLNEDSEFTPVQLLGMLFSHLKQLSERVTESPISDCVIGIPSYFTDLQRRAYLDAAAIAGLRPLRLMHDLTSTALEYGIYKTDVKSESTFVVFVDIGHCDTQVCVAKFDSGGVRIIAHTFDRDLGGRDFDEVLFKYFGREFREVYNIDVWSNLRASIRLRAACEKLKRVLSANAEAPISIECLMDEKDVKSFIKREDFETLSSGLLEKILLQCNKALIDARLTTERIHSVELVGSGSRIPAISKALSGFFRKEPRRTLNSSECIARGCALQCAMLSPVFRVRNYEVRDLFPFSIQISADEGLDSTHPSHVLFRKGAPLPSTKILSLQYSQEFSLETTYADKTELPHCMDNKISRFTVGPFPELQYHKIPIIKVRAHLNLNGVITIDTATLIQNDYTTSPLAKSTAYTDQVYDINSRKDDAHNIAKPLSQCSPIDGFGEQKHDGVTVMKERNSKKWIEIPVNEVVFGGMTTTDISLAQALEKRLTLQDRIVEQTKERKNALEAYVYDSRNMLFEKYMSFVNASEKEEIASKLQETEEWLYEEGDDESEKVYLCKMEELKKLICPIEDRFKEERARTEAISELKKSILHHRRGAKALPTSEINLVITECDNAERWLKERMKLQDSLQNNVPPVIFSNQIRQRTEKLNMLCQHITGLTSQTSDDLGED